MKVTTEMLEKAKSAKSAEELLELAKAENVELTADEAAKYFAELHKSGELSDEELENAAGGGCDYFGVDGRRESSADVVFLFAEGQTVMIRDPCNTRDAIIIERAIVRYIDGYYYPRYKVKDCSGSKEEWVWQNIIRDL